MVHSLFKLIPMDWFTLALISAILSALAALTQKKILFKSDALEFSFILGMLNIITSFPLWYSANFSDLTVISLIMLFVKTFIASVAFLNVMLAIKNMEISGALPLMVLTPGIVAVFAFFFLGEVLSVGAISGLALLTVGTYILEVKKGKSLLSPFKVFVESKKHHYILTALLCFTITAILDKTLMKSYKLNPQLMVIFQQVFSALCFTLFLFYKKKNPVTILRKVEWKQLQLIILVSFLTVGYRYFTFASMKIAPTSLVLSVKRLSVFIATLAGGKLFNESRLLQKIVATLILLSGTWLILNY